MLEIKDTFSINGRGVVVIGKLLSGSVRVGMTVSVLGKTGKVLEIEAQNSKPQEYTKIGGDVGVLVGGLKKEEFVKGHVLSFLYVTI